MHCRIALITQLCAGTLFLCASVFVSPLSAQIYVKADATGANNGTSWADAFSDLQDALTAVTGGTDIWVAAGTYRPTSLPDRAASFHLINGVGIYGGFAGTETTLGQRDLSSNTAILSGEIGLTITNLDNSYHVVNGDGTDATAILDGFTIMAGYASGGGGNSDGGGFRSFTGSPTLANLIFESNTAAGLGGGMYVENSDPVIVNIVFRGNSAVGGGGMSNGYSSDPVITNVTFYDNTAQLGGAVHNFSNSNSVFSNVIVWGNTSTTPTSTDVANVQSAPVIAYSLIEGSGGSSSWDPDYGTDGGNNIDVQPEFVDAPGGDLRLELISPAVNVGDNTAPSIPATDLDGNDRIAGGVVDMGAYEIPLNCPIGPVVYVDPDATGAGDGSSWADAFIGLDEFEIPLCLNITEVWVAEGTYKPTSGLDRTKTFVFRRNLGVYGGFGGTETMRSQRDPANNLTILSGDIGGVGTSDNSFHVVTFVDATAAAVFDGFTILGGNADSTGHNHGGGVLVTSGSPTLQDVIFSGNLAESGGGIYVVPGHEVTLTDVVFDANTASVDGGGSFGKTYVLRANYANNHAGGNGGGAYTIGGVVDSSTFNDNTADGDGAGLYAILPAINVSHTVFSNNDAGGHGGGAYGRASFFSVDLMGNTATGDGGGARLWFAIVDSSLFDGNSAANGGGLTSTSITIKNSTLSNNQATGSGGGVRGFSSLTMNTVQFTANNAGAGGGAYVASGNFTECTFDSNTAGTDGGGVYSVGNAFCTETTIANNTASGKGGGWYGGALLSNSAVEGNSAGQGGGGIYLTGGTISFSSIDSNTAVTDGGGVYRASGAHIIADVTLTGNLSGRGGGMYTEDPDSRIIDVTFTGNTAAEGGGLYNTAPVRMINLILVGNLATSDGGGIYNAGAGAKILNALLLDNTAVDEGGGVFADSEAIIVNVTLNNNSANASGGGLQNADSSTSVANTILWTNSAPSSPEVGGVPPLVSSSDISGSGGSGAGWDPSVGIDGGDNIDADPQFVNEPGDDFHLLEGSPAVNAGNGNALDANITTDLDGNPRRLCRIDMGPYERPEVPDSVGTNIRYVEVGGSGDGLTWGCAMGSLSDALAIQGIDEIWVAEGTYTPGSGRTSTFLATHPVTIYGGFAGGETSLGERDVLGRPTILSGEIGNPGNADNVYHVVSIFVATSPTFVLDGLFITGGNADGQPANDNDVGGGVTVWLGTPILRNCVISGNNADFGGGVHSFTSNVRITNCIFLNNTATVGGGYYGVFEGAYITNSTFYNNTSADSVGAIFYGANLNDPGHIKNTIVWGNASPVNPQVMGGPVPVSFSLIDGSGGSGLSWDPTVGVDAGNNIDTIPMFVDATNDNFRLLVGSPAMDAGDNTSFFVPPTDIEGNPRIANLVIDMGPHEYIDVVSGVGDDPTELPFPKVTRLRSIYPNPFNPTVTIVVDLDRRRHVRVDIYDIAGRRVDTVIDETRSAGTHNIRWNAGSSGKPTASGVYFVLIRSEGWRVQHKIVLLK